MGLVADVVDVSQALDLTEVEGSHLDQPVAGKQSATGRLTVSGWVLARESPVVAVEVNHAGATLARTTSLSARPDVAAAFPEHPGATGSGFALTVGGVWGEPIELKVLAVLSDRSRCQIGIITVGAASDGENSPLVSVVIPCYGQAHLLPDAIDSVLSQTHPNVEIIVVDDGSPDNAAAVTAQYPGVRYVRQENRRLPGARNTGIRESTGQFLVFLDADDMLLPVALRAGLDCYEPHPECGFVSGRHRLVFWDGQPYWISKLPPAADDPYRALLRIDFIGMHATCMFRREALQDVGGFDETLRAAEDYDLYLRIARKFPLHCHDTVLADYRYGGNNMSNDGRLMLESVVSIVRRQRRHVVRHKELRLAYAEGLQYWRGWYGPAVVDQVSEALVAHDWSRSLRGIVTLLRCDPKSLSKVVRHLLRRHRLPNAKQQPW